MDYSGNLWVGTRSGLVRYDGTHLKVFELDQRTTGQTKNNVLCILNIASERKTIIKTRYKNFYLIENGKPVLLDDKSRLDDGWSAYVGQFPSLSDFKNYLSTNNNFIGDPGWWSQFRYIFPAKDSSFIMGSDGSNTLLYYKNGIKQRKVVIDKRPKSILSINDNIFFLDDEHMMYLYNQATNQSKEIQVDWRAANNHPIMPAKAQFINDPFSKQVFCFYDATCFLLRFDSAENHVSFLPQFSIKDKRHFFTSILYDSLSSTFFLGTEIEGFFQVKLKKMATYSIVDRFSQAKPSQYISYSSYSVLKINDSTVITPSGLQFSSTPDSIEIRKLQSIHSIRETIALLKDGSVLCYQDSGIYYYSPSDGYRGRHAYNDSLNKRGFAEILMLYPEGDSIWLNGDGVIYCLTRNRLAPLFTEKERKKTKGSGFRYFYRLNNKEALVASETGLFKLKTSAPYSLSAFPEMEGKQVRHITPYKDVLILSVYQSGIYVYKNAHFYKVPIDTGRQQLNSCHSTYIDKKGFIWIPTDRGLYRSTPSSMVESALNNAAPRPFFWGYGNADGIDNVEFNGRGVPTYAVIKNGRIFYPSMVGIVTFIPEDITDKIQDSPPLVEKILIDGKESDEDTDSIIRLQSDFKYFTFELVAPFFGDPANIVMDYKLDHNEWQQVPLVTNMHRVTLVNISSGKHQLIIRKRIGFGNTDFTYKTITIIRKKSIYEKVWFYIAVAAAVGFLIWLFLHLKIRSISRKKAALQKKVDEQTAELSKEVVVKDLLINIISHDMATPLRHISFVSGVLAKGLEKDPEKAREALTDIQSTSEKILSGSLTIINWMKYNNKKITVEKKSIHLYNLVNEVLDIYMPVAKSKGISLINDVPGSKFVEADNAILATIFNNLVSNAIKHIANGEIRISFDKPDIAGGTVLKISDTGSGMSGETLYVIREILKGNLHALKTTDKINTGLGYIMIAELVRIHDLSLSVESELKKGTTVSLTLG